MKISKLALIALLGGALAAFGCSDDDGSGGSGGSAGSGGAGGQGGSGGISVIDPLCADLQGGTLCANGDIEPTVETCTLPVIPSADACDGTESLTNPATCTAIGTTVTVDISELVINGDCNVGYDLDSCGLNSCVPGGLAPGEGVDGIDNALAGLAPVLAGVGGNLGGVNQAFHDGICAGDIAISFAIDANDTEGCANVDILDNGVVTDSVILNLSATGCLSGTIGTIPLNVAGIPGSMGNAVVRVTLSADGLSNGTLGATVDEATAGAIADALIEGGSAVVGQVLDINEDLSGDTSAACNALSMTLIVGGTVPALN